MKVKLLTKGYNDICYYKKFEDVWHGFTSKGFRTSVTASDATILSWLNEKRVEFCDKPDPILQKEWPKFYMSALHDNVLVLEKVNERLCWVGADGIQNSMKTITVNDVKEVLGKKRARLLELYYSFNTAVTAVLLSKDTEV